MQLRSLKVFCDIVRLGSFSKAAELNGVSQPSASQLVHHLEERLGVQLIDRSRRPFVVTDSGQLYYEGCQELVRRYDELEHAVREAERSPGGRLRVGAIYSIGLWQMHQIVEEIRDETPSIDLHIDYLHPKRLEEALAARDIDLAVTSYPETSKRFLAIPWRIESFAVAVAPNHPLAMESAATVEALAGEAMVMPQSGLRVRDEIDCWLASHRVEATVAAEFDNFESIKRAIEIGEGIGLLPAETFETEARSGTLIRLKLVDQDGVSETFTRPLGVLHRRGEELSDPAIRFLELLKRHAGDESESLLATSTGKPVRA